MMFSQCQSQFKDLELSGLAKIVTLSIPDGKELTKCRQRGLIAITPDDSMSPELFR